MSAPVVPFPDEAVDPWLAQWNAFELGMEVARKSPQTVRAYRDAGEQFHAYLAGHGLPLDPVTVERRWVSEFLAGLHARHRPATVRARYSALRRFFNWLVSEGELERSPMERMESPQVPEEPVEFVSDDEVRQLLAACSGRSLEDRRDSAILLLMYDTGMRRGALVSMTVEDTDVKSRTAQVRTKGERTLLVPFGAAAALAIARYQRVRPRHHAAARVRDDGKHPLWLAQKGFLTGWGVYQVLERRVAQAGIQRQLHPHMFRHSFADRWKSAGGSEEGLMRVAGWRDSKVLRRYGSMAADARARQEHARVSPADRLLQS